MPLQTKSNDISKDRAEPIDASQLIVRWTMLFLAVVALGIAALLRVQPELLPQGSLAVSELSGRVGLVLLCGWFAWPAFRLIRSAPGGLIVLLLSFVAAILFIARPKSALLLIPILIALGTVVSIIGWLRRDHFKKRS